MSKQLATDFKGMFGDESFTDFEIEANDGETLKAHKVILAARSPVFFAMLTKLDLKETKECSVKISDFDSKTLKELLRFIYCNQVEGLNEIAIDLFFAAEKYNLELLKQLCVKSMIMTLTVNSIAGALAMTKVDGTEELYECCLSLIIR